MNPTPPVNESVHWVEKAVMGHELVQEEWKDDSDFSHDSDACAERAAEDRH